MSFKFFKHLKKLDVHVEESDLQATMLEVLTEPKYSQEEAKAQIRAIKQSLVSSSNRVKVPLKVTTLAKEFAKDVNRTLPRLHPVGESAPLDSSLQCFLDYCAQHEVPGAKALAENLRQASSTTVEDWLNEQQKKGGALNTVFVALNTLAAGANIIYCQSSGPYSISEGQEARKDSVSYVYENGELLMQRNRHLEIKHAAQKCGEIMISEFNRINNEGYLSQDSLLQYVNIEGNDSCIHQFVADHLRALDLLLPYAIRQLDEIEKEIGKRSFDWKVCMWKRLYQVIKLIESWLEPILLFSIKDLLDEWIWPVLGSLQAADACRQSPMPCA